MKHESYKEILFDPKYQKFEFLSVGKYIICKRGMFVSTDNESVYNLVFGDAVGSEGIEDYSISNNGDRDKILVTLINIIDRYTSRFPERWIYFKGNTEAKSRLYRMAISI